jgi:hypothetical protein
MWLSPSLSSTVSRTIRPCALPTPAYAAALARASETASARRWDRVCSAAALLLPAPATAAAARQPAAMTEAKMGFTWYSLGHGGSPDTDPRSGK